MGGILVSVLGTLRGLTRLVTQFVVLAPLAVRKLLIVNIRRDVRVDGGARLEIASGAKRHRRTAMRSRINGFLPSRARWCDAVFVPVLRGFRVGLTQFLHNS